MKILKRVLLVILVLTCVGSVTAAAKPAALENINIAGIGRTDWIKDIAKDNQLAYDLGFGKSELTDGSLNTTYDRLDFVDIYETNDNNLKQFTKSYDLNPALSTGSERTTVLGGSANLIIVDLEAYYKTTKQDFLTSDFYKSYNYISIEKNNMLYLYSEESFNLMSVIDEYLYIFIDNYPTYNQLKSVEKTIQLYDIYNSINGYDFIKEQYGAEYNFIGSKNIKITPENTKSNVEVETQSEQISSSEA